MSESNTKNYTVGLRKGFPYPSYHRAGMKFDQGAQHNVSLTPEQAKVIKADKELEMTDGGKQDDNAKLDKLNSQPSLDEAKKNPSGNHSNVSQGYNGGPLSANPDDENTPTGDQKTAINDPARFNSQTPASTQRPQAGSTATRGTSDQKPELKKLLKNNSRDSLLEQAKAAGVEVPETAEKREIAKALLDAKKE